MDSYTFNGEVELEKLYGCRQVIIPCEQQARDGVGQQLATLAHNMGKVVLWESLMNRTVGNEVYY